MNIGGIMDNSEWILKHRFELIRAFEMQRNISMSITFYDNTEDMLEDLRHSMNVVDSRVLPWQSEIRKGDHFRQSTDYGFDIYGEVLKNAYRPKYLRNYRFCKCYSEACPEGELGDVHVSIITEVITKDRFDHLIEELA